MENPTHSSNPAELNLNPGGGSSAIKPKERRDSTVEVVEFVKSYTPVLMNPVVSTNTNTTKVPLFEIRQTADRGLAVFAVRSIPRGTRILSNKPLFHVLGGTTTDITSLKKILSAFNGISPTAQATYLSLSAPRDIIVFWLHILRQANPSAPIASLRPQATVMAVWQANAFTLGARSWSAETEVASAEAVFPESSRFNHSCVPNAHFAWNAETGAHTVHAARDIQAGEEVMVSYLPPYLSAMERGEELSTRYAFECRCPACNVATPFHEASEKRRRRIRELEVTLWVAESGFAKAPGGMMGGVVRGLKVNGQVVEPRKLAGELADLLKQEGLVGRGLAVAYGMLAKWSEVDGDLEDAISWVDRQLDVELACLGEDHRDIADLWRRLEGLKKRKA